MARRAGKAASRRARQRNVPRQPARPTTPAPEADATVESGATSAPPPTTPSASGAQRPVAVRQSAGSQLTSAERSEYHYVERDLRDIAILTVVMTALLLLAWFVFTASGIFA